MKALTVCQPYADLILDGSKPIENRTWPTSYRGRIVVHAGKSRDWLDEGDTTPRVFGAALGTVEIVDCVRVEALSLELQAHEHANGPWCWLVARPDRWREPVPMRGRLGLFDLTAEEVGAVTGASMTGEVGA